MDIHAKRILILDFGSQYTQLIARRIREIGVYCEIHPYSMSNEAIIQFAPAGIILSGGPESVLASFTPRAPEIVFAIGSEYTISSGCGDHTFCPTTMFLNMESWLSSLPSFE